MNPPQQIAQFGFNQDNWMWPRHNADFAVFRIYADAKGRPARYAKTNVPLHRDKWLPISLRGVETRRLHHDHGLPRPHQPFPHRFASAFAL